MDRCLRSCKCLAPDQKTPAALLRNKLTEEVSRFFKVNCVSNFFQSVKIFILNNRKWSMHGRPDKIPSGCLKKILNFKGGKKP